MTAMAQKKSPQKTARGGSSPKRGMTVRLDDDEWEMLDQLRESLDGLQALDVNRSDAIRLLFKWAIPQAIKNPKALLRPQD